MRPLEVVADGCAVEHNDVGHNPARSGVADPLLPTRSSTVAPPVRIRLWSAPDRVVATVSDRGDGPADPFAGLLPLTDTSSAGLGLWLTHQLSSHVTLDTTDDGFTIRLIVGTPQPGRSGHAPDPA
jgi:Histidine kinase-like ATPase domain